MLKTCVYCGRIHDASMNCPDKARALKKQEEIKSGRRRNRDDKADRYRHTGEWKHTREHVLHRDRRLCLCCLAGLEGTQTQFETRALSVHHIVPLNEDYSLRIDEENLITVCAYHHEACEGGAIGRDVQRELVEKSIEGTLMRECVNRTANAGAKISPRR